MSTASLLTPGQVGSEDSLDDTRAIRSDSAVRSHPPSREAKQSQSAPQRLVALTK